MMAEYGAGFREYCENTTSHCMIYFKMKHRSLIEKWFWILVNLSMALTALFFMHFVLYTWLHNPTIMFVENTESAIQEIPFPQLMICPSNQYRKQVWDSYENTGEWENLQQYRAIQCSSNIYAFETELYRTEYFDFDELRYLINACPISCQELIASDVKWKNYTISDFCRYGQPIITMLGLCYSFNMIPMYQLVHDKYAEKYSNLFPNNTYTGFEKSHWNLDDGYSYYSGRDVLEEIVPSRTSGVSYYHRFKVYLHTFHSEFIMCPNNYFESGYIFISAAHPTEYGSMMTRMVVQSDTYTKIQIIPKVILIGSDLKWRSPEVRKCYLHDERKLEIFKHYTETNCMTECTINLTISMCNCVTLDSILLVTRDVKMCGLLKRACSIKAIKIAQLSAVMRNKCKCLPTCNTVEYEIAVTSSRGDWDYLKKADLVKNNSRGATLEFIFKNPYFTAYRSASILNLDSFISGVGGILSLFLGVNLINIFEILYGIIKMAVSYVKRTCNNNIIDVKMF